MHLLVHTQMVLVAIHHSLVDNNFMDVDPQERHPCVKIQWRPSHSCSRMPSCARYHISSFPLLHNCSIWNRHQIHLHPNQQLLEWFMHTQSKAWLFFFSFLLFPKLWEIVHPVRQLLRNLSSPSSSSPTFIRAGLWKDRGTSDDLWCSGLGVLHHTNQTPNPPPP